MATKTAHYRPPKPPKRKTPPKKKVTPKRKRTPQKPIKDTRYA